LVPIDPFLTLDSYPAKGGPKQCPIRPVPANLFWQGTPNQPLELATGRRYTLATTGCIEKARRMAVAEATKVVFQTALAYFENH
tara:strand:+ start:723 stop:974 length:252 start_codon:yes stop_codon:yes gene_type:complete